MILEPQSAKLAEAANVGVRFIMEAEVGKPTAQIGKGLAVLDALGLTVTIGDTPKNPLS